MIIEFFLLGFINAAAVVLVFDLYRRIHCYFKELRKHE